MNELIERLAREAGFVNAPQENFYGDDLVISAFAKAVARECAEIASDPAHFPVNGVSRSIPQAIRERFGL